MHTEASLRINILQRSIHYLYSTASHTYLETYARALPSFVPPYGYLTRSTALITLGRV